MRSASRSRSSMAARSAGSWRRPTRRAIPSIPASSSWPALRRTSIYEEIFAAFERIGGKEARAVRRGATGSIPSLEAAQEVSGKESMPLYNARARERSGCAEARDHCATKSGLHVQRAATTSRAAWISAPILRACAARCWSLAGDCDPIVAARVQREHRRVPAAAPGAVRAFRELRARRVSATSRSGRSRVLREFILG